MVESKKKKNAVKLLVLRICLIKEKKVNYKSIQLDTHF